MNKFNYFNLTCFIFNELVNITITQDCNANTVIEIPSEIKATSRLLNVGSWYILVGS